MSIYFAFKTLIRSFIKKHDGKQYEVLLLSIFYLWNSCRFNCYRPL